VLGQVAGLLRDHPADLAAIVAILDAVTAR